MIHLCIFGGQDGQLTSGRKVYFTLFGACELRRPTTAKQIIDARQRGQPDAARTSHFFITLFGATGLKAPTLAQEYLGLQDALRAGLLTLDDWDRTIARVADANRHAASLTLFGRFDTEDLPSENEELDDLALNRHLGHIPDEAVDLIMPAIGQRGSTRPAVVRQALAATLREPA